MDIGKEWDKAIADNLVWQFLIKHGMDEKSKKMREDMPQNALDNYKFQAYADIYKAYLKAKHEDDYSDFLAHGDGNEEYSRVYNRVNLEDDLREELKIYSNLSHLKSLSMHQLVTGRLLKKKIPEEQIIREIKRRIPQNNSSSFIEGPCNISTYTKKLMEVAADFLNNRISDVKIENNKYILYYENGHTFDLSECLAHANLSHINFPDQTLHKKFVDFAYREGSNDRESKDYNNIHPCVVGSSGTIKAKGPEYFRGLDDPQGTKLSHLSDAEIAAINIYTTEYYNAMNDFLEGKIKLKTVKELKEVLLSSVFCAAGLNKTPIETYYTSYRGSSSTGDSLEKKKNLASQGGISYEKGFTSTSFGRADSGWIKSSALIFTDGVLGQNVDLILSESGEREILIIPTQIQYLGFYEEKGITYFLVKSIRTLSGLTPEFQGQEHMSPHKNLNETLEPDGEKSLLLIFSELKDRNSTLDDKSAKEFTTQTEKPSQEKNKDLKNKPD